MEFFKRIFHRKREQKPRPLRIDGVKTTLTPVPDDAELAAQALLESMTQIDNGQLTIDNSKRRKTKSSKLKDKSGDVHGAEYYRELGEKIRAAREQDRRMAMRFVAYVEQELELVQGSLQSKAAEPSAGFRVQGSRLKVNGSAQQDSSLFTLHSSLNELEHQLFKHQNTVEREGGELLKRWQRCLAECIMRQMTTTEATDLTD